MLEANIPVLSPGALAERPMSSESPRGRHVDIDRSVSSCLTATDEGGGRMTVETAAAPAAAASWQMLGDRLSTEENPAWRRQLEVVAEHVDAEVRGDIDRLMATLVPDPQYHFWGSGPEPSGPKGAAGVRAHYEGLVASGMNRLEFAITRVAVDDDLVVTEGAFRHAIRGNMLTKMGHDVDHATWYLIDYQSVALWVFQPGSELLIGEDIYFGGGWRVRQPLVPGEMPHLGPIDRTSA